MQANSSIFLKIPQNSKAIALTILTGKKKKTLVSIANKKQIKKEYFVSWLVCSLPSISLPPGLN